MYVLVNSCSTYEMYLDISSGMSGGVESKGSRVIINFKYVEDRPLAKKSSSFCEIYEMMTRYSQEGKEGGRECGVCGVVRCGVCVCVCVRGRSVDIG